jgi:hypothetical protein
MEVSCVTGNFAVPFFGVSIAAAVDFFRLDDEGGFSGILAAGVGATDSDFFAVVFLAGFTAAGLAGADFGVAVSLVAGLAALAFAACLEVVALVVFGLEARVFAGSFEGVFTGSFALCFTVERVETFAALLDMVVAFFFEGGFFLSPIFANHVSVVKTP